MQRCVDALRAVHEADAYPSVWPDDPAGWLTPPGVVGAWVAESETENVGHVTAGHIIVGHVIVVEKSSEWWVSRLFVTPAARGLSVGRALLAQARTHACGRPLMLDVIEDSADALALYERTGWTLIGRRPADWLMADGTRPTSRVYTAPI